MKIMVAKVIDIKAEADTKTVSGKLTGIIKTVEIADGKVGFTVEPAAPYVFNDGKEKSLLFINDEDKSDAEIAKINDILSDGTIKCSSDGVKIGKKDKATASKPMCLNAEFLLSLKQNRSKVTLYLKDGTVTKLSVE